MIWRVWACLLLGVLWGEPLWASGFRMAWSTVYETNLFETPRGAQEGWVSKITLSSSLGYPLKGTRGRLRLKQQVGFKRFWEIADTEVSKGDVLVAQVNVDGQYRLSPRWGISAGGYAKFKQSTRVPGEESYLRGTGTVRLTRRWGRPMSLSGTLRVGADGSRDILLPGIDYQAGGIEGRYSPNRSLSATLRLGIQRIGYDRLALALDKTTDRITTLGKHQTDWLRTVGIDVQAYRGALFQVSYVFLSNRSNSYGYPHRAHRVRGVIVRHIGRGIDAQVFAQIQVRAYRDAITRRPAKSNEDDEYEQNIAVFKLSRTLLKGVGLSVQYAYHRNGAKPGDSAYRKHACGISLDAEF